MSYYSRDNKSDRFSSYLSSELSVRKLYGNDLARIADEPDL